MTTRFKNLGSMLRTPVAWALGAAVAGVLGLAVFQVATEPEPVRVDAGNTSPGLAEQVEPVAVANEKGEAPVRTGGGGGMSPGNVR
ncbi:MAG: hypothetical protein AAF531_10505 [Actinomycetota bacterium]